jgi:hypothetical protein
MKDQWEYLVWSSRAANDAATQNTLTNYGRDGWELVSAVCVDRNERYFLKRIVRDTRP